MVDALDECEVIDGCRRALLAQLLELSKSRKVHVMVTSRLLPDISNALHTFQTVEVRASNEDIGKYVEYNFSKLPNFVTRSENLQDEIKNAVISSADGIFLLATLYLQSLQGKRSPGAMRTAIKSFDKGSTAYSQAYEKTMDRITSQIEDQRKLALETLVWVVYAQRSLTVSELLHALATDIDKSSFDPDDIPDIEDVLSACCGLIIVEQESKIVRLVHRTAQEFFQRSDCTWLSGGHTKLGRTCTTYLSFPNLGSNSNGSMDETYKDQLTRYPLWNYASWYWQYHSEMEEVPRSLVEFGTKQEQVEASSRALMEYSVVDYLELCRQHPGITGLHLLARCGLTSAISSFLQTHDINARDRYQQTPISYALQGEHADTITLLIKAGACLDGIYDFEDFKYSRYYGRRQRLLLWSMSDRPRLAKLLIEGGAQLDFTDEKGRSLTYWAIQCRDDVLLRLLLEKGLDPDHRDMFSRSPLSYALEQEYAKGMEILLAKDPDLSLDDSTSTHSSCTRGIDQDKKEHLFRKAAYTGMVHTVSWWIKYGLQVDRPDRNGETALMFAVRHGSKPAIEVLLKSGADVNLANVSGRTPLMCAIEKDDSWTAALLIKSGARVNIAYEHDGTTALMLAAGRGKEMTQILLRNGADIHATNATGMTALIWAAHCGTKDVIAILLDYGSTINQVDSSGRTALMKAAATAKTDAMAILIEAGAEVHTRDKYGWTALMYAAQCFTPDPAALLLRKGARINDTDHHGRSPLSLAIAEDQSVDVICLLRNPPSVLSDLEGKANGQTVGHRTTTGTPETE